MRGSTVKLNNDFVFVEHQEIKRRVNWFRKVLYSILRQCLAWNWRPSLQKGTHKGRTLLWKRPLIVVVDCPCKIKGSNRTGNLLHIGQEEIDEASGRISGLSKIDIERTELAIELDRNCKKEKCNKRGSRIELSTSKRMDIKLCSNYHHSKW